MSWLEPEAPFERLRVTRTLVGLFATLYCVIRVPYLADFSHKVPSSFAPAGIVALLAQPLPAVVTWPLALVTIALGVLFTLGRRLTLVGPAFFVALLWTLSYANSWGKLLHSENLFLLHVGVLVLAGERRDPKTAGWVLRTISIVTILTYVLAGVTKLRNGGAGWLTGEALGGWLAWDALRKIELGSTASPLAPFVASHPALLQMLAIYTLIVELGAPVALVSPRTGRVWAALAWTFHAGILATMWIGFFYPLSGVALLSLLPAEKISEWSERARRRRVDAGSKAPS
ncbi:MAG: hypothetical protein U0270_07465 [Labilithrix sp.]